MFFSYDYLAWMIVSYSKDEDPYGFADCYETEKEAFDDVCECLRTDNAGHIEDFVFDNIEGRDGEVLPEESIILEGLEYAGRLA